jgi:hypothetical protein
MFCEKAHESLRNGVISPITFATERPRPFRTISLMRALARFTE